MIRGSFCTSCIPLAMDELFLHPPCAVRLILLISPAKTIFCRTGNITSCSSRTHLIPLAQRGLRNNLEIEDELSEEATIEGVVGRCDQEG